MRSYIQPQSGAYHPEPDQIFISPNSANTVSERAKDNEVGSHSTSERSLGSSKSRKRHAASDNGQQEANGVPNGGPERSPKRTQLSGDVESRPEGVTEASHKGLMVIDMDAVPLEHRAFIARWCRPLSQSTSTSEPEINAPSPGTSSSGWEPSISAMPSNSDSGRAKEDASTGQNTQTEVHRGYSTPKAAMPSSS